MRDFKDKVAAITGAGSGMGREIAILLAKKGCHLALSDVNVPGLKETEALVSQLGTGVRVTTDQVNVAKREQVYKWADKVVADHGKVNLIFNNAGVALSATVEDMTYEDFDWLFNINFWGVVYGTKAFLPYIKATGDGHIVNTSSVFGLLSVPSQAAYNSAKFAVRGFTDALRMELEMDPCGVSATTVHPGGINTNIAKTARVDQSIDKLGLDHKTGKQKFENMFITSPRSAAKTIVNAVWWNRRRVLVGPDAVVMDVGVRFFPTFYQIIVKWYARTFMA